MTVVSQRELRNSSAEVLRRVESGETIVVTRRGVPIADLVPHREPASAPSRYVTADAISRALGDVPPWGATAFEKELDELDATVDDELRDPWAANR